MADKPKRSRAEALWDALRKAPERAASPDSMVRDIYGETRRGAADTKAAARDLGVSQRTIQRWLQQGMPKRSAAADALAGNHSSWLQGRAGRRARLSTRREARLRNQGTTFVFHGKIRISQDVRTRGTTVKVSGAAMGRILDASLAGNDADALVHLEEAFGAEFGGSVELMEIKDLDTFG